MGLYYSNMKFIFMCSQQRHVFETIVFVIKITGSAPDTSPTILMIKNILLKETKLHEQFVYETEL